MNKDAPCSICSREGQKLTFHHLIPRTLHQTKWYKKNFTTEQMNSGIYVCSLCHRSIHDFIPEKEMGREYNTLEKLLSHEKVINFIPWAVKQK